MPAGRYSNAKAGGSQVFLRTADLNNGPIHHQKADPTVHYLYSFPQVPARLAVLFMLARRLERLEHGIDGADAEQYHFVVQCLTEAFAAVRSDAALFTLLDDFPAARQLYENLHYARAGLCRSPQPAADEAARLVRDVLSRVGRPAKPKRRSR